MTENGIQCQVCGKITGLSEEDMFTCDPVCSEECGDKWKASPGDAPPQNMITITTWAGDDTRGKYGLIMPWDDDPKPKD